MLKENLVMLRNSRGFSQEQIAEKIGISRQAYAKWESGATIPDIEKCSLLADVYGVSIDGLIKEVKVEGLGTLPPAPAGKYIWGTVTVNNRGQIVIPKDAREKYDITGGTRLIIAGDEVGIALIPVKIFEEGMKKAMGYVYADANKTD